MAAQRNILCVSIGILLLCALPLVRAAGSNLVDNSGFEDSSSGVLATGWSYDSWLGAAASDKGSIAVRGVHAGKRSLALANVEPNDARFVQPLSVQPATWYRASVWIKTQGTDPDKVGAHLSVMGTTSQISDLRGTQDWHRQELYFHTGPQQTRVDLALRLGFYGSLTRGTAWFDDVEVEPAQPPQGAVVLDIAPAPKVAAPLVLPPATTGTSLFVLTILAYSALAWWGWRRFGGLADPITKRELWIFAGVAALALTVKLALSATNSGYGADMGTFSAWAHDVFHRGPSDFYQPGYFADYPPGYLWVLWLVGALSNMFQWAPGSPEFLVLLKLPSLLADVASAVLLLKLGQSRASWVAGTLWLLSPLAAYTSAVWGQVDAVFSLALLAAFWSLEKGRLRSAAGVFTLAVLLKPQALLVAPLGLLWLLVERGWSWKTLLSALGVMALVGTVIAVPFALNHPPLWLLSLYSSTVGYYDYATINAANLWYLLGQNWVASGQVAGLLTWGQWGWSLTLVALGLVLWAVARRKGPGRWLSAGFAVYVVFFSLAPQMHERYLFPAALLGLGAYARTADGRWLVASIAAALVSFVNIAVTYQTWAALSSSQVPSGEPLMVLASVTSLLLVLGTLAIVFDLRRPANPRTRPRLLWNQLEPQPLSELNQRWVPAALGALIVVYSALCLVTLGSPVSPQRFWEPQKPGTGVLIDLGRSQTIAKIEYHFGLGKGSFALEYSSDAVTWTPGVPLVNDNAFAEFRWRTLVDPHTARFVRMVLVAGPQQLNELALVGPSGESLIPATDGLKPVGPTGASDPHDLFDEQQTRVAVSDWTNGMYFDEVYFPRSAWEILQGRRASENTHPPLGKLIIAASVAVGGLNPFFWRLPGALAGIVMIPLVYLMARRLLRHRGWALLAAVLLSCDFLHFTQTRIATIDSLVVVFILGASYGLLCWFQESHPALKLGGISPSLALALSGLSISLAIATKWTGIYAAAGLAVLFFVGFAALGASWRRQRGWSTLGLCVVVFVVLPTVTYVAAYLPEMASSGQGWAALVENQTSMWNYHSGIKDTHPFSSAWYQWPLIEKPVWYYSGSAVAANGMVSSIVALGNPVIWYLGSLALLSLAFWAPRSKPHVRFIAVAIALSAAAQYLPWAINPRKLVFLYHFLPTVPFLILGLVFAAKSWTERHSSRWPGRTVAVALGGLSLLWFILYFPVISGMSIGREWMEGLRALGLPIYF